MSPERLHDADSDQSLAIEEFTDLAGELGIDYQKRGEGLAAPRRAAGPILFMPRCSSVFEIVAPTEARRTALDAYSLAIAAPGTELQVRGVTAVADGVYFFPSAPLIAEVGTTYGVEAVARFAALSPLTVVPRTNWLNEVMHRYVYERAVARGCGNLASRFLEQEIVKEAYYRLAALGERAVVGRFDLDPQALDQRSPVLRAAMDYIESNLFRDIAVADVAGYANVSESTLLREFRARLNKTPQAYLVDRRLEEAMVLLKSRRYGVGQVSDIVGYENVSSFSAAFKRKYGISPSQVGAG